MWAAKHYEDAIDAFLESEALGYTPSYYYLGLAREEGRFEGEAPDLAAASELYLLAAADGFAPAIEAYQGIEWGWEIDFKSFNVVWAMRVSYENLFADLDDLRMRGVDIDEMVWYASGIQDFLELSTSEYDGACPGIARPEVGAALRRLRRVTTGLPADKISDQDDVLRRMTAMVRGRIPGSARMPELQQDGSDDADLLVAEYGGCDGEPLSTVYRNISAFALSYEKTRR